MLKHRILTALIVGPVFAWVTIWANNALFNIFWALVVGLAAREWGRLIGLRGIKAVFFIALTTLVSALGMYASLDYEPLDLITWHWAMPIMIGGVSLAGFLWLFMVPLWLRGYARTGRIPLSNTMLAIIGCILLPAFSLAMMVCRIYVGGVGLFGLFALVWCADIGAYFVGKTFGKHPLAPAISPKKTREGFFGGWIFAMLAAVVYYYLVKPELSTAGFFISTALVLAYATVGDLFESILKRRSGFKDSGRILPGHGGVLDRIDSWLPAMVLWSSAFFFSTVFAHV